MCEQFDLSNLFSENERTSVDATWPHNAAFQLETDSGQMLLRIIHDRCECHGSTTVSFIYVVT